MPDNVPISARVPPYYRWVVERLQGTRFKNKSDAVTQMMAAWIEQHNSFLAENGLRPRDFNKPRSAEDSRAKSAVHMKSTAEVARNGTED